MVINSEETVQTPGKYQSKAFFCYNSVSPFFTVKEITQLIINIKKSHPVTFKCTVDEVEIEQVFFYFISEQKSIIWQHNGQKVFRLKCNFQADEQKAPQISVYFSYTCSLYLPYVNVTQLVLNMSLFSIFTSGQEKKVNNRIRKPAAANSSFGLSIETNL